MVKSFYSALLICAAPFSQLSAAGGILAESCQSGVVQASMTRIGTKNIYYFATHHEASTLEANKQQLDSFIAAIKETEEFREGKLHVLFEKPHFQYTHTLDQSLKDAISKGTVKEVTFEDAEIRHNHIEAAERMKKPVYYTQRESTSIEIEGDQDFPHVRIDTLGQVTFEMVLQEYDDWHRVIAIFRRNFKENDPYFKQFDDHWNTMEKDHREFLEFLFKNAIPLEQSVASTALHLKRTLGETAGQELIEKLDRLSLRVFSFLFDLHLFKKIFEYEGEHIAIVGGLSHTSEVSSIFFNGYKCPTQIRKGTAALVSSKEQFKDIPLLTKDDMISVLKGSAPKTSVFFTLLKISVLFAVLTLVKKKYAYKEKNEAVDDKKIAGNFLRTISENNKQNNLINERVL